MVALVEKSGDLRNMHASQISLEILQSNDQVTDTTPAEDVLIGI